MNKLLWDFYINRLQGHPTPCRMEKGGESIIEAQIGQYFKDKDAPLLILGCADGTEITSFRTLGFTNVFGITLDEASKDIKGAYVSDMHDLTIFPVEHFKYVYANHSFEHSLAPMILCLEVWAAMQPGGLWYINYPANITTGRSILDDPLTNTISHHHPNLLEPNAAITLFEVTGFDVIDCAFTDQETFILEKIPLNKLSNVGVHDDVIAALRKRSANSFYLSRE